MWKTQASQIVKAPAAAVWRQYVDVERWSEWDDEVEWCKLEGPFVAGTRGKLKPKGGPTASFQLLEVEPNRRFHDRTSLPLTKLDFEHLLEPVDGGVRVTHTVTFSGPLAFLFSRIIGRKKLEAGLPRAVGKLAARAEASG